MVAATLIKLRKGAIKAPFRPDFVKKAVLLPTQNNIRKL